MSLADTVRMSLAPPHRAARPFLVAGGAAALAGLAAGLWLTWLGVAFLLFCLYFFRDPERTPPGRPDALLAPADGRVVSVGPAVPPPELGLGDAPRWRVGIFLSMLNVHVNRVPADGVVTRIAYRHGRYFDASLDKASEHNERNALAIRLGGGQTLAVVQVAGLVARRIVCAVREGDAVRAGARFGIIRFGSRTDLYLPEGVRPLVAVGQTMVGGETVVATLATVVAPAPSGPPSRQATRPAPSAGALDSPAPPPKPLRGRLRRRRPRRRPRYKGPSFNRLVPNILTMLGLCAGLTSIRFALDGRFGDAAVAITVAGCIDGLDGRLARLLKATSRFGAEFDSLTDFLCFGVAPAFVLYLWALREASGYGFAPCLIFAVCMALRLARFNASLGLADEGSGHAAYAHSFFTGVPAPAGAGLALFPLFAGLEAQSLGLGWAAGAARFPLLCAFVLLGASALLVSTLPVWSFKNFKIPSEYVLPVLLGILAFAAVLVADPWAALAGLGLVYVAMLPFSLRSYRRLRRDAEREEDAPAP